MRRAVRLFAPALPVLALLVASCGDTDRVAPQAAGTTAPVAPAVTGSSCTSGAQPLQIVLVNDDGVINPAIDVLIDRLAQTGGPAVEVTVVAPAQERSGSSDRTTPTGAAHRKTTTPGGNEAYAVDGYPADAVIVALDRLGLRPHLVVSGINPGQNFGPFAALSGTVGAARTAIRRGVPALAVSAGLRFDPARFAVGADLAAAWITEHCAALTARTHQTGTVTSINVPDCAPDRMGPLQKVPRALVMPPLAEGENIFESTCDLGDPAPADDIAAVRSGYPSLTPVEPDL